MELWLEPINGPKSAGTNAGTSETPAFRFDGGIIGRAPECQIALPESERMVSRQHAGIKATADGYSLTVLSETNPVLINGQMYNQGQTVALRHGDVMSIGSYEWRLRLVGEATPATNLDGLTHALRILGQGLGYPLKAETAAEAEQQLLECGQLIAELLDGTRRLLSLRNTVKSDLTPTQRTMVFKTDNNPLKFASSRQELLNFLFNPSMAAVGLQNAVPAAREALTDIRVHDEAVIAGMRAALAGTLKQLEPARIDAETKSAALDHVVPGARAGKLWQQFEIRHQALNQSMQQSLSQGSGGGVWEEFKTGYSEHVAKAKKTS